jgi:outer membrane protein TolC
MRGYVTGLLITIMIAPLFTVAQQGTPLTLEEALKYAERNQVKIKNAILDQRSSDARNKEVTGLAYPQLKAKGGINYAPVVAAFLVPNFIKSAIAGDPATGQPGLVKDTFLNKDVVSRTPNTLPFAFQPRWTTTGTLEASQVLFDPSVMVALQARKVLEEMAAKSVDLTVQDVKVGVSKAYYNILIAEKQQALVDQNISRMEQMEFETNEIYKNGFAEKIDVDRITVTLNNLRTQKIKINQMIRLAYLSLKFQMGMPLDEDIELSDTLSDQSLGNDILTQDLDFTRRNEFQLLQAQKRLYSYDVKRYKLGWLPTLSMFGNYGYTLYNSDRLFQPGGDWQKSALLGVNLNVPIFDGFQRRNKRRQAEFTLQKTNNDIDNLRQALSLENENARISLSNNVLALENQRKNMALAETVYNTARIKYKEGVGSSLEVMNAESSLKEAQTNYFTSLYDVITSRIDLQKSLGLIQ